MTPRHHRTHRLTFVELCRWSVTLTALVVAVTAAFVDEVGGVRLVPVAMVLAFVGVAASLHVLLHPEAPGDLAPEAPPAARALVPVAGES